MRENIYIKKTLDFKQLKLQTFFGDIVSLNFITYTFFITPSLNVFLALLLFLP